MEIKICGITKPEEAQYLNECKVDYAGFVFYEKSKRNITVERAKEIFETLNPSIRKVAVMVSPGKELIEKLNDAGFDILQMHKELTAEALESAKLPVWYAVNITSAEEIAETVNKFESLPKDLTDKIVGLVVDAKNFGSGVTFDWQTGKNLKKQFSSLFEGRSFILAGGLKPENVKEGITFFGPDIIDVSSGVECENGKDFELIKEFTNNARG